MPERVLVICTSTESNVRKALQRLPNEPIFKNPVLDFLCTLADLPNYESRGAHQVLVFPNRRNIPAVVRLWWRILRERYVAVVVLWCLDQEWRRPKLFALLCGGRRLLVFNENLDCSFLTPRFLRSFMAARLRDGQIGRSGFTRFALVPFRGGVRGLLSVVLFPVRFIVLTVSVAQLLAARNRPK